MFTTQYLSFLGLSILPLAEALLGNPIDWDDFSNNFGTDIAPLLSLFGENPTKQFLSESTSIWDSVLFGIAPLGIITTVVSVIRIYGNSSWKSFIGRAQEPHGLAEAELCSSTSDDVCELWSNGGICRVFGRPKMLAFIFTRPDSSNTRDFYSSAPSDSGKNPSPVCGIETPKELLCHIGAGRGEEDMEHRHWEQTASTASRSGTDYQGSENHFAPYPNLSLTIGFRHRLPMWVAIPIGVILQLLFFGLTIWFTYYIPEFYDTEEGQMPVHWAFGLTVGGTVALNFGMTLCARLIDKKSSERHFKRKSGCGRVYWLQPGGQRVGDQLFNAFAYCDSGKDGEVKYITSWPVASEKAASPGTYYIAVVVSMLGWVIQFIGLRLVPGVVSLSLFGITVIMSIIRAALRSSRLPATANLLNKFGRDILEDHELDWQALELVMDQDNHDTDHERNYHKCWHISEEYDFPGQLRTSDVCTSRKSDLRKWMQDRETQESSEGLPNGAAQALRFRSRLAYLTSEPVQPVDQAWSTEIRKVADMLQKALESSADEIFSNFPLLDDWQELDEFAWLTKCETSGGQLGQHRAHNICFHMRKDNGTWIVDRNQLEASLGLWLWSLRQNIKSPRLDKDLGDGGYVRKSIVVADSDESSWQAVVSLWVTQSKLQTPDRVNSAPTILSVPTETRLALASFQSLVRGSALEERQADDPVPCHSLSASALEATSLRLSFRSRNSRLQLIAQELFTVFMDRVATIIKPLEEIAYKEPPSTDILGLRQTRFFGLFNPQIDAVAKALINTGLASREEALMSVVPALGRQKKLPSIEKVTETLLLKSKAFRREGKLRQSESLLNGLFFLGPKAYRNWALRDLGEVYRAEMRLGTPTPRDTDVVLDPAPAAKPIRRHNSLAKLREQVDSMKRKVIEMETDASDEVARDTLQCYEHVLQCHERRIARSNSVTPKLVEDAFDALFPGVREKGPTQVRKREIALTLKDEGVLSECHTGQLLDLLRLAIEENIPELIEDMWSIDRELIHTKVKVQDFIVQHGSSPDGTPLWWAIDSHSTPHVISSLVDWPSLRTEHTIELGAYAVTVLGRAVQMQNEEATRLLLQKGANCNTRQCQDMWGQFMYPLVTAAENGNLEILRLLLKFGAATDNSVMQDALRKAVTQSRVEATEVLLRYIRDLNDAPNSSYYNAADRLIEVVVPQAILGRNIAMVECLRRYGANVTDKFRVSFEMGQFLWENMETIQEPRRNSHFYSQHEIIDIWTTALAIDCTKTENSLEFDQYLIDIGVDVNVEVDGGNALIFAVLADNVEMVEYLLEQGANPARPISNRADFGNALIAACGKKPQRANTFFQMRRLHEKRILEMLLSKCSTADINVEVQHGLFKNALIAAVRRSEAWVVRCLLDKGASVSARMKNGHYGNALIAAAHLHRVDCLESMILSKPGCLSETLDYGCRGFRSAFEAVRAACPKEAQEDIEALDRSKCFDSFYDAGALPLPTGYVCSEEAHRREVRANVAVRLIDAWAAVEDSEVVAPVPPINSFPEELYTCHACRKLLETD